MKYVCNCFHGLKVSFANEIGSLCKAMDIDSHEVMRLVCEDKKLNISPAYLRPGFAFGGSCLPKDLRALVYRGKQLDVETPLLAAVLQSNRQQIDRGVAMVLASGARRVGILGMAFKAGTDDLRESPDAEPDRAAAGQGHRAVHLRPRCTRCERHWREPGVRGARHPSHLVPDARVSG